VHVAAEEAVVSGAGFVGDRGTEARHPADDVVDAAVESRHPNVVPPLEVLAVAAGAGHPAIPFCQRLDRRDALRTDHDLDAVAGVEIVPVAGPRPDEPGRQHRQRGQV